MFGIMVFCEVISTVGGSLSPNEKSLTLTDAVADPMKMHIYCFGSFLFHIFIGNAGGNDVVGDHRGGRLGVDQLFESDAYRRTFFAMVEKGG